MPLQEITVVQAQGHQALVGFDSNKHTIMVALRGSLSLNDWIDNIKAATTVPYPVCPGCRVAAGFLQASLSLVNGIEDSVTGILANHPGTPVVVTGHSLGAAMAAILLANSTAFTFGSLVKSPVYTFGQVRTTV